VVSAGHTDEFSVTINWGDGQTTQMDSTAFTANFPP
jgi:hypothetical protein